MSASMTRTGRPGWAVVVSVVLPAVVVGLGANRSAAEERHWRQPLDGLFNLAANWDPQQVPGVDDAAIFDLGDFPAYTATFDAGGSITNAQCRVHSGSVNLALNGSTYTVGQGWGLIVGDSGGDYGILALADGQFDAEGDVPIALGSGSAGELTLDAGLSMTVAGVMIVGDEGTASLYIADQADLDARAMTAGVYPGSSGSIRMTGDDAHATLADWLYIGEEGYGELTIEAGASIDGTPVLVAGVWPGGYGDVTVTGLGSALAMPDGDIVVADWAGGSGSLLVADHGTVQCKAGSVGYGYGGVGDLTVTDAGSLLEVSDYLDVGTDGWGSLQILGDATAVIPHVAFGTGTDGWGSGSVAGPNATLSSAYDLNVGTGGTGDFTVEAGGFVEVLETIRVGWFETGVGNVVVRDANSTLSTPDGGLIVGDGNEGTLDIYASGSVDAAWVDVGGSTGSYGQVWATNPDTLFAVDNDLVVGAWGTGELTAGDGAHVQAGSIIVGGNPDSEGALTATGPNTEVHATDGLRAGETGLGSISINDGAVATAAWLRLGYGETGEGNLAVSGTDAQLHINDNVEVGVYGHATLDMSLGAVVTGTTMFAGWTTQGSAVVDLTGDNTRLTLSDTLFVGEWGDAEMYVGDQANATVAWLRVGQSATAEGTLGLYGQGSTITVTEDVKFGNEGVAEVHITGGAEFHTVNPSGWITAGEVAGSFGHVRVDAAGVLSADQAPIVWATAGEAWLQIQTGGSVYSSGELFAGTQPTGAAYIDIVGAGSTYETASVYPTKIGDQGTAYVTLNNGGQLKVHSGALLGMEPGSVGEVTLYNPASLLDVPVLLVGRKGAATLTVNDGRVAMNIDPTAVAPNELRLGPGAELGGTGTIAGTVVNEAGITWPGGSLGDDIWPGTLSITGDCTQLAGAAMYIELGGTTPGDEYCTLAASGTVTLDGELRILTVGGFTPEVGQTFEIVTAGVVTGEFSSVTADERWCVAYEPTGVSIALLEPGDMDGDCDVDLDDYAAWAGCLLGPNVPTSAGCADADLDGDNDVDLTDFARFQTRFEGM